MELFTGVTAMETRAGPVTVREVAPVIAPDVAVMVVLPAATAVASPPVLMVAVPTEDEVHVAVLVRFCVVLSV